MKMILAALMVQAGSSDNRGQSLFFAKQSLEMFGLPNPLLTLPPPQPPAKVVQGLTGWKIAFSHSYPSQGLAWKMGAGVSCPPSW